MVNNFIFSKDTADKRVMHLKSDSIQIIIYDKSDEVIMKLFESALYIDFIYDCYNLLY